MFSPINLFFRKAVCSGCTILSSTFFSLFAKADDRILYVEFNRVIGLQLEIKFRGFEGFGTRVICPSLWVMDNSPISNPYCNDLHTKCFKSAQNVLKNSYGNPSDPGLLLLLSFIRVSPSSSTVRSSSIDFDCVSVSFVNFTSSKYSLISLFSSKSFFLKSWR